MTAPPLPTDGRKEHATANEPARSSPFNTETLPEPTDTAPALDAEPTDNEDNEDDEPAPRPPAKRPRPWPSPKKPPARTRRPNKNIYNRDYRAFAAADHKSTPITTPNSYREAMASPEAHQWLEAMTEEINAITRNGTFRLVRLPKGRTAIGARWLFKVKCKANSLIDRFKARWVAKGYSQLFGIDFDETFSPIIRLENLRLLLAIALPGLAIHQMDVDNAFLNAELTEEIYVEQPEGFEDRDHPDYVCQLQKSLYGLKQAPLEWNRTIDAHLKRHDFKPTQIDPCIYVRTWNNRTAFIAVYVDDCTIIAPDEQIDEIKGLLHQGFRMKDLGRATSVLGLEILRDQGNGAIFIRQARKIHEIVHDFGLASAKPIYTPMDASLRLPTIDKTSDDDIKLPYRSVIGRLSYIALATRPDIAFAVNVLSRHVNAYSRAHWEAAKRVIRYLKTTLTPPPTSLRASLTQTGAATTTCADRPPASSSSSPAGRSAGARACRNASRHPLRRPSSTLWLIRSRRQSTCTTCVVSCCPSLTARSNYARTTKARSRSSTRSPASTFNDRSTTRSSLRSSVTKFNATGRSSNTNRPQRCRPIS